MILEMDAGNSRVKWRLMRDNNGALVRETGGFVLANTALAEAAQSEVGQVSADSSTIFLALGKQLACLPASDVSKIKVSSVKGDRFNEGLSAWVIEKWALQPDFAAVERFCGNVKNSYKNVANMGVDRWLAMLAAFNDAEGPCCVVDCGSAITLDLVDGAGQHLGGYIVPGFHLMQEALSRKSPVLDVGDSPWNSLAPGLSTGGAIVNGLLSMVLGLVEGVARQHKDKASINWYLTGGDANLISPLVTWEHKVVPDLVMDGLAISVV